jgi:hypothetical protein
MQKTPIGEANVRGVMAERVNPNTGKRALMLRKHERKELARQRMVETAVAMFLSIEQSYSWQQVADEIGVSMPILKEITKSDEFIERWNQHFAELGHDPRLKATQGALWTCFPLRYEY